MNKEEHPGAHLHVFERNDAPYMTWGTTAYYIDRCVICGRIFQRERPCMPGMPPWSADPIYRNGKQ